MSRRRSAAASSSTSDAPQASRFQAFVVQRLPRSAIKGAPYNPRQIDPEARKKLQRGIQKHGLLEPITWNRRSGFLVGGHQRLAALDALEGREDYHLDVSVVDLDDAQEREANVLLNNPAAQGSWDRDLLANLLRSDGVSLDGCGLEAADVESLLDGMDIADILPPEPALPAAVERTAEEIRRLAEINQGRRDATKAAQREAEDTETWALVTFATRDEREAFVAGLGYPRDANRVDGADVVRRMKP